MQVIVRALLILPLTVTDLIPGVINSAGLDMERIGVTPEVFAAVQQIGLAACLSLIISGLLHAFLEAGTPRLRGHPRLPNGNGLINIPTEQPIPALPNAVLRAIYILPAVLILPPALLTL